MQLMKGGPYERFEAVQLAGEWGDKSVVSVLRRGLRDSDIRIVEIAAIFIEQHRCSIQLKSLQEASSSKPPRNVALMR